MNLDLQPAPERKGAGENALELKDALDDFLGAFESFKDANDERLGEIERKLSADVVTEEKVNRISDALDSQKRMLDRLVLKGRRPELGGERRIEASEHKAAFENYVRSGDFSGLKRLEAKAVSSVTTPDSGYLVPPETEAEIGRRLAVISPIRSIAASARCRRIPIENHSRRPASRPVGWARRTRGRRPIRRLWSSSNIR